jgi:hypothetical protein
MLHVNKLLVQVTKIDKSRFNAGNTYTIIVPLGYSSDDKIIFETLAEVEINNMTPNKDYNNLYNMQKIAIHYNNWSELENNNISKVLSNILQQLDNINFPNYIID